MKSRERKLLTLILSLLLVQVNTLFLSLLGEELEDLENPEFNQPEKRRKISKSQKKIQGEVTLVEEEQEGLQISSTSNEDFLVFPPKIVAMHRVRWNPNLGSERWLCYGGAAGIIRCQVIDFQHA